MTTLADFLAARYDEAEALARATDPSGRRLEWRARSDIAGHWVRTALPGSGAVLEAFGADGTSGPEVAAFSADVDPAHRLADIKLKRAILRRCIGYLNEPDHHPNGLVSARALFARQTLMDLGTEFDQHPEYQAGWAP